MATRIATFAAGCFWGVELAFSETPGVVLTRVGYTGCEKSCTGATYEQVCNDETGCAEAVEVTYDPAKTTYEKLLEVFWRIHDPTTMDRQGPDVGSQYRSGIFYHDDAQKTAATNSRDAHQNKLGPKKSIVTEITKASQFFQAEDYHQQYLKKRGLKGGCHI
ncbi:MAG: peptide-methionine (S)-S-oxide reductase MsrA [Nanoarchaeota archaeon]